MIGFLIRRILPLCRLHNRIFVLFISGALNFKTFVSSSLIQSFHCQKLKGIVQLFIGFWIKEWVQHVFLVASDSCKDRPELLDWVATFMSVEQLGIIKLISRSKIHPIEHLVHFLIMGILFILDFI